MNRDPALDTFLAEAAELLATMEGVLLRCEQGVQNPEAINELFRAAHTIKGSAGLFGLDTIVGFTHVVESVLDSARAGGLPITAAAAAILLECSDHIGRLVGSIAGGGGGGADDPELVERGLQILQRLTSETGFSPASAAAKSPAAAAVVATAQEPDDGVRALTDSWHISVRFRDSVLRNGMDPLSFIRYLTTFGTLTGLEVVDDALPALEQFDAECCYIGFEIGFKTDADKDRIAAAFEFVRDDCTLHILAPHSSLAAYAALLRELPEPSARIGELLVRCGTLTAPELALCLDAPVASAVAALPSAVAVSPGNAVAVLPRNAVAALLPAAAPHDEGGSRQSHGRRATDAQPAAAKAADSHSIRVDGDKLDRLIDWIGELIIAGAATGSIARKAGLPVLQESALQLAHIVGEIRDQALKLRMMQIGSTFSRFHRVVRDVARELGKDITLEVTGAETELDRTLVEGIADPLTHLVRNAIDHGIETPDVRLARGKSATGLVRLNAYHDAGSVVIEVSDDGGGLKRDRILAKATERGLISPGEALTDAQVYALIFEPGFSTAEAVTNLSGRGVGMDVVKRNISALRGTVEVHSEEGQGTQVCIRLPLTLAIIDGFEVGVGRSHFVIPLDLVEECVDASTGGDAELSAGAGHIILHGSVLPLIRLRDMFSIQQDMARRQSIVVVRSAGKRVGLMVDELLGELQAVIKPLSKLFSELQGIGGSTILGTGKVALILDIPGLIERTHARNRSADEAQRSHTRSRDVATS
jgi:two-component system chemotaxis sensor kinase CheA